MSNYVNAGVAITPDDINTLHVSIAAGEYLDYWIVLLTEKGNIDSGTTYDSGHVSAGEYYDKTVHYNEDTVQVYVSVSVERDGGLTDSYYTDVSYIESGLSPGDTFNDGKFIYEVTSESTAEVVGHLFDEDVIAYAEIPYSVEPTLDNKYTVTEIDGYNFSDVEFIELRINGNVTLDSGVTIQSLYIYDDLNVSKYTSAPNIYIEDAKNICSEAFKENIYVLNVYMPNTVKYIGENAFDVRHENLTIYYDGTKSEWDSINKSDNAVPDYVKVVFKGPNYNIKVKIDNNLRNVTNIFYKQNNMLKSIKNFIYK